MTERHESRDGTLARMDGAAKELKRLRSLGQMFSVDESLQKAEFALREGIRLLAPVSEIEDTARLDWVLNHSDLADRVDVRWWEGEGDYLKACREGIDAAMRDVPPGTPHGA